MIMVDDNSQFSQGNIGQQVADATAQDSANSSGQVNESTQIASIISDLDRRLRMLEERYGNLRKKLQLTDQNLIESERSFGKQLRSFNTEALEMKRSMAEFDEKVVIFGTELENIASKTDLKVLEKYLAMWNPQMYVTRKELREYLNDKKINLTDEDTKTDEDT